MIVGLRHSMYVEWIADLAASSGIRASRVDDALGNPTDQLVVRVYNGRTDDFHMVFLVVPPPPDDWTWR